MPWVRAKKKPKKKKKKKESRIRFKLNGFFNLRAFSTVLSWVLSTMEAFMQKLHGHISTTWLERN